MTNTARFLSIATLAAFASFGAQAATGTGEFSSTSTTSNTASTVSRAEVQSAGAAALPNQKNNTVVHVSSRSDVARSDVRAEAVSAIQAGGLATGQRS